MLLAAHCGFRRSDAMRISPANFDQQAGTISIDQKKTGRTVTVPVTAHVRALFAAANQPASSAHIYAILKGRELSTGAIDSAWQILKKKASVNRHLWIHDLRRTLAVSLYEISKDLRVVEQMLGHQSLGATIHYLEHRDASKLKPYLDSLFIPDGRLIQ